MKAKRRHELQENVLAIELGKIAEFLKKRGNHLATGALVIALVLLGIVYISKRTSSKAAQLQARWDRALSGEVKDEQRTQLLTELAEQTDHERIAALASVELGDEYARRRLAAKQPSERSALLERASAWYMRVLANFPQQELAIAKARYGIAKLAETERNFERAAEEYRRIRGLSGMTGHPVAQLAEIGLRRLKMLQEPVRMATTAPATQPSSQPTSRPATRPATPKP
jgi:hypothetical protein